MNFKYLIFLCLMFIVSMGAVSAADDVNSTFNANIDVNDVLLIQLLLIILFIQIMQRNTQ